jgi:hypothetical protein
MGGVKGARPAPNPQEDLDLSASATQYEDFVSSLSGEGKTRVNLKRLPCDLTPETKAAEALFPAPRLADFETMQEEIARRYGIGEYALTIMYFGPNGREDRKIKSMLVRIGQTGFDDTDRPGEDIEREELPADPLEEARAAVGRALSFKANAIELKAATDAAGMGAATGPPQPTLLEIIAALKSFQPPAPVAPGMDTAGSVGLLKEVLGLAKELGGGGEAPGFWAATIPHIVDLIKTFAPYLPNVAAALVQARAGGPGIGTAGTAAPAAGVVAVPEIEEAPAGPGVNVPAVLHFCGGNMRQAEALKTFLDVAYIEARKDHTPASLDGSYNLLADLAESNCPGLLGLLAGVPAGDVFAMWSNLDGRLATDPRIKVFCEGFHAFLQPAPEEPPAAPATK